MVSPIDPSVPGGSPLIRRQEEGPAPKSAFGIVKALAKLRRQDPAAYDAFIAKCRKPEHDISGGPARAALRQAGLLGGTSRHDATIDPRIAEVARRFADHHGDRAPLRDTQPIPGYSTTDVEAFGSTKAD